MGGWQQQIGDDYRALTDMILGAMKAHLAEESKSAFGAHGCAAPCGGMRATKSSPLSGGDVG